MKQDSGFASIDDGVVIRQQPTKFRQLSEKQRAKLRDRQWRKTCDYWIRLAIGVTGVIAWGIAVVHAFQL
jgi:hypothetical protein